jgi:Protein of unknown function (DUF3047)
VRARARARAAAFTLSLTFVAPFGSAAAQQNLLAPLDDARAWTEEFVPGQKVPKTRFAVQGSAAGPVLRIESAASYGNKVHRLAGPAAAATRLQWRWRLDEAIAGADLLSKPADDAALKVCVLFDLPIERVPFMERQLLRFARAFTGEPLPAATVCYVWVPLQRAGSLLPNAHTRRLRWIVLQGDAAPLSAWRDEARDLRADFLRAFGDEAQEVPPILAIAIGGDADNTGGRGAGQVSGLELRP